MKQQASFLIFFILVNSVAFAEEPKPQFDPPVFPDHYWKFDSNQPESFIVKGGKASLVEGIWNSSLMLDGNMLLEAKDSSDLTNSHKPFSLVIWFNPYQLNRSQQVIMGKNRYSLNEREWSVMIDEDQKLRLYVHQGEWATLHAEEKLQPGHWYQLGITKHADKAELWLNGKLAGELKLSRNIPHTLAPITFGGIDDNGRIRQNFLGALSDAMLFNKSLSNSEMMKLYTPTKATHTIPEQLIPLSLWDPNQPIPAASQIPHLEQVKFQVIKKWDRAYDGYTFLHGVGLGWHRGKLYASIGHNKGAENTVTEEAQYVVSEDAGQTWSELRVIDAGSEPNLAVSHGVFLSHEGILWAFHGAYTNHMENIHTRAYQLDEASQQWIKRGVVIENGFWPMNQPLKMQDGNWIMPGISAGLYSNHERFPAAVAISHGDDFTQWEYVEIPTADNVQCLWGESSIFIDGNHITNIARYGQQALALGAMSKDFGRTWTASRSSNLPMATSKPAAGTLSTGQHYLICTNAKNNGVKRSPLTIALTRPGENMFSSVYVIRDTQNPGHPGESSERLSLSYPCAIEHEGQLYVGYSNNGGRKGNLNSAELAIIPIEQLQGK